MDVDVLVEWAQRLVVKALRQKTTNG